MQDRCLRQRLVRLATPPGRPGVTGLREEGEGEGAVT